MTNELLGKTFSLDLAPNDAGTLGDTTNNNNNATNAFVPEPRTDPTPGSTAMQRGAFLNLALLAGPGIKLGIAEPGFGALASLVECMVTNVCLDNKDDVFKSFLQCFILPRALPVQNRSTLL